MLELIALTCSEHKVGLLCAIMSLLYLMVDYCEDFVFDIIITTNSEIITYNGTSSCPYFKHNITQYTNMVYPVFYLNEMEMMLLMRVNQYAYATSFPIIGVLSDKYGGHNILTVCFLLHGLIMGTLYLTALDNFQIFLLMYALRRFSAHIWPAITSIIGKSAKYNQRSTFCAYFMAASGVSQYLAVVLCSLLVNWKAILYTCSAILIISAISWKILWLTPLLPPVPRTEKIPWLGIFGPSFLVNIYFLKFAISAFYEIVQLVEVDFFEDALHINRVEHNHLIILSLCILCPILNLGCGIIIDYYITTSLETALILRKIFFTLVVFIFFISMILMLIAGCNVSLVLVTYSLLTTAYFLQVTLTLSILIDLSPNFAGTSSGLSTFTAVVIIQCIFGNNIYDILVTDRGNIRQWHEFFVIMFIVGTGFIIAFIFCNTSREIRHLGMSLVEMSPVSTDGINTTSSKQQHGGENL